MPERLLHRLRRQLHRAALPIGYKISAFWAGQEGSLLFWGVTLAVMAAAFVFVRRRDDLREQAVTLLVLSIICGFFAAMLLLVPAPIPSPQPS